MKERASLLRRSLSTVSLALAEDLGSGDVTSDALFASGLTGAARIFAKEDLVVAGQPVARQVFAELGGDDVSYEETVSDGDRATKGATIAVLKGPLRVLLSGERVALNFLQRLSGIASTTRRLVNLLEGTGVRLLDTRKTTPGLRLLEKYAVLMGGGNNHRFGLYDAALIKNNHVDMWGSTVASAIHHVRAANRPGLKVEVEVRNHQELASALDGGPDIVMLDNFTPEQIDAAVAFIRSHGTASSVKIEVSGGITEETLKHYARPGVDFISMGALTHSVRSVDIALHVERHSAEPREQV